MALFPPRRMLRACDLPHGESPSFDWFATHKQICKFQEREVHKKGS